MRCHRFLKGEDTLVLAWAGSGAGPRGGASGVALELPAADRRRDGSGSPAPAAIARIAGPVAAGG